MPTEMRPGDLAVQRGQQDGANHDKIHDKSWKLSVRKTAEIEASKLFPGNDHSGFRLVYVEMYKMACREARQKHKRPETLTTAQSGQYVL